MECGNIRYRRYAQDKQLWLDLEARFVQTICADSTRRRRAARELDERGYAFPVVNYLNSFRAGHSFVFVGVCVQLTL